MIDDGYLNSERYHLCHLRRDVGCNYHIFIWIEAST